MSDHKGSAAKFPYLVIPNNAATPIENIDGVYSSRGERDNQLKREAGHPRGHNNRNEQQTQGVSLSFPKPGYLSYIEDPYQSHDANFIARSHSDNAAVGPVAFNEFNLPLMNSISMSQMKAILTAQKELRKPAGALYPTSSQISLIPETELIYKKYFPSDGTEHKVEKMSCKTKVAEKEQGNPPKLSNISNTKDKDGKKTVSASLSVSESTLAASDSQKMSDLKAAIDIGRVPSGRISEVPKIMPCSGDKQSSILKQKEADARFKKRIHAQLVSLCAEVERQSLELIDMRKEFKEVLQMSRQNSTDIDSSKSRLDTLSKHVHEIDNKMDAIQESVSGQEKSLLSKLMLIGEMSDSDSDLDDPVTKGIDALSCPSATKLSIFPSTKRPFSAGSSSDCLPKSCCNWVPIAPDFDKLIQAVALINYRMDRNQSMKLCSTNNGATFKHSDVIELTIYKNGIILGSTGFRSYSTMSVIRFVNEIFNGYLPTELSTQYPDGVVIVLTDKRSVIHACDENFNGSGTKLTGKDPPDLLPGTTGINVLQKKDSMESLKASTVTSMISLPLPSNTTSVTNISSYEMLPELRIVSAGECDTEVVQVKIITLKVNDRKNGHRYKLKVPINATIKAVTNHLSSVLAERNDVISAGNAAGSTIKSYDMILPVPRGKLSCTSSTLEEYGLTQNTLVYIQERKF